MSIRPLRARRAGFTLVEVAVTIVIVGIGLVLMLEGLNMAKITAAHTRNLRLARDLGMLTLGQVESGLFRDDIEGGLTGNYAQEGWPDFAFELVTGEEAFRETATGTRDRPFDSWAPRDTAAPKDEDEDEEQEQPFAKVRIKVLFPRFGEFSNELVLERWMPWKQVYGEDAAADGSKASASTSAAASGGAR